MTGCWVWESAQFKASHTQARGAPARHPRAAPTARKASAQKQACRQGGERPQARQGDEGRGPAPRELNRRSTGPGQEMWRSTNRLERPYRRPAPEPRVVRAPGGPRGGGSRVSYGRTGAHTRNGHAARTRRATGGARGTHRPHGMAYWQAKGRDTPAGQPATRTARDARAGRSPREARTGTGPEPPDHAASAAHTPRHFTRQGSSSTQCYAPAPWLPSLRASPWGSHW